MKVLLYFEGKDLLSKSGIGRAYDHQRKALNTAGVEYSCEFGQKDYDILHINTYGINSQRVIKQARRENKKIIYHAHSTEEDFRNSFVGSNQLSPLYKKHLVRLYSSADRLITPTPYSKKLIHSYGIKQPIEVISNGIEIEKYVPNQAKEAQFRSYFGLSKEQKVIISVGLYFERKGIIDFIEIAKKFPQYTFIWFGHTPLYSIPSHIRKIVQGNHPKNVIFPGYIKGDVLEGAYSGADLFFFPSYEETEGIVVLEALASHQNILVREIPVYNEWLFHGKNCFMGKTNEEFAHYIESIVEGRLPDLTQNGFESAQSRNLTEIGKQLKNVYEDVLATN